MIKDAKHTKKPPRFAEYFLNFFSKPGESFSSKGDFEEIFNDLAGRKGIIHAQLWYWSQILRSVPKFLRNNLYWSFIMFNNYFKIAFRNLSNYKVFSLINIFGLAVGMTCCILILMFVSDELSYDNFHINAERIYRIPAYSTIGGTTRQFAPCPPALAPELERSIPEIETYVRIFDNFSDAAVRYEENTFNETGFLLADSTFFKVFTFDFISGDPETALSEPGSIVITEETAKRLFGDGDPLDKILTIANFNNLKITGVIKEVPQNSHFRFNYVLTTSTIPARFNGNQFFMANDYSFIGYSYVLLSKGADPAEVEKKIINSVENRWGEMLRQRGVTRQYPLQPLKDIHLRSKLESDIGTPGNIDYIYLFSAIAVFVLFIACLNFINLSTARSANRAREVGLRKVFGAFKTQLVRQFLSESVFLSVIGAFMGLFFIWLVLPSFNGLTGKNFALEDILQPAAITGFITVIFAAGIIAGIFPAFVLSAFAPVKVLKGKMSSGTRNTGLRKVLVAIQFSISIFMIVSIFVILKQIDYMKNKNLGFNKEQVLAVEAMGMRNEALKERLKQNPGILSVSYSNAVPGSFTADMTLLPEGKESSETIRASSFRIDYDFIDTYDIEVIWGRNISREFATDSSQAVIINETAAREIGWDQDAIGRQLENVGNENETERFRKVVGIIKDIHHKGLQHRINPTVLLFTPRMFRYVSVKVSTDNISGTIDYISDVWKEQFPQAEFNYFFMDEYFNAKYQAEERVQQIYTYFGIMAILIACLGLYGLAAFTAEQRTRETGIRKVLGATIPNIIKNISSEFIILVLASNALAWPAAHVIMKMWLGNFAYTVDTGWLIYFLSGLIALFIAVITVSYQALKAAKSDPVKSLRHD
ncbi:ABC transporter permease [candidate division KSB1 bacterium]